MDNKLPLFLDNESITFSDLPDGNVLNLGDPPEQNSLMSLNIQTYNPEFSDENMEDKSEQLLYLKQPPILDDDGDKISDETKAISKFAEEFVEPILKEVIARHKSEIEDESNELHSENNIDKKSEKSSSDDGFEYVKSDEVIEEMHHDIDKKKNDDELIELIKLEVNAVNNTEVFVVSKDDAVNDQLNMEEEEVLRSMDNFLDSVTPTEISEQEQHFEESPLIYHDGHATEEVLEEEKLVKIDEHNIKGKCKDIINWTHPVSSAVAFAVLMFIELGLLLEHSIISLLAYSGLLLMMCSFLYKVAVNFRFINTQSSMNCILTFNKDDIEYCVGVTLEWIDYLHKEIKAIAYVDSLTKNIKVFFMLWVLTYIGQMFNLQSLIFIGSLLLFSLPVVYGRFKSEIDALLDNVRGLICDKINKIKSKCCSFVGCR